MILNFENRILESCVNLIRLQALHLFTQLRGWESSIVHTTSRSREQTSPCTCCRCKHIGTEPDNIPIRSCLGSCWILFEQKLALEQCLHLRHYL